MDGMTKIIIDLQSDVGIHFIKNILSSIHPFDRYVEIGIAGADEYGCLFKISPVIFLLDLFPDYPADNGGRTAVSSCISG